jgi:hypothetical protein
MTIKVAMVPDFEADVQWREWQARGAESDRRTATRMRTLMLLIAAALATWLSVVLA